MPIIDTDDTDPNELLRLATENLTAQEVLALMGKLAADAYPRDRDKFVAACPLSPDNLVGSYFRAPHDEDDECDEGLVVANPHATPLTSFYLVEFFGKEGASGYQQVVDLERMVVEKWQFFDGAAWLTAGGTPLGTAPKNAREALKKEQNG